VSTLPPLSPYPLHLDLRGKPVLVVGAGPVGVRRARGLAAGGAVVSVIALEAPADLELPVARRAFEVADVKGRWLVMACTGVVDDVVAEACEARGIWCVRADDATLSAAWVPAVAHVDDVVVSVTAGRDPRRATTLRDALQLAIATGQLPLRRTRPGRGSVAFVGGGPGDPELLTVRGARLLAEADVVVRDRNAPDIALHEDVEVVETDAFSPEDVCALLVDRGRAGKRVVRLQGVAAAVEEHAACIAAGLAVVVVPGVGTP